jgi:microsomal dipeptidase-like Zn-dependent dipeptidase
MHSGQPVAALMLKAGYSKGDVSNILGNNWLRIFREVNDYSSHSPKGQ